MQLTLKWKNHNTLPTTTKIYRSEALILIGALPEPIATVNAANEQHVDTVEYGKRYYYLMENTNSKGSAFTNNKEIWGLPRTGPGPQSLISGDMNLGYFGYVKNVDFISAYGLLNKLNGDIPGTAVDVNWLKFVRKGKILFIPTSHITNSNSSPAALYAAGLVYGSDDAGAFQYGAVPRNQRRTVLIKGDEFIVRCPRMTDSIDFTWDGGAARGEWYDLIVRSMAYIPNYQTDDNLADFLVSGIYSSDKYNLGWYKPIFQDRQLTDNKAISTSAASEVGMTTYASISSYAYSSGLYFRPVLELVNDLFL